MANGGKRPGAGRKTNAQKALEQDAAAKALGKWFTPNLQESVWKRLIASNDENVQLKTVSYLSDRLYGRAPQALDLNLRGQIEVIKRVVADL